MEFEQNWEWLCDCPPPCLHLGIGLLVLALSLSVCTQVADLRTQIESQKLEMIKYLAGQYWLPFSSHRRKEAVHLQTSTHSPTLTSPPLSPLSSLRCISHHFHSDIVSCPRIVETIKVNELSICKLLLKHYNRMDLYIKFILFLV